MVVVVAVVVVVDEDAVVVDTVVDTVVDLKITLNYNDFVLIRVQNYPFPNLFYLNRPNSTFKFVK